MFYLSFRIMFSFMFLYVNFMLNIDRSFDARNMLLLDILITKCKNSVHCKYDDVEINATNIS
jgi:hypothetical protein